MNIGIISDTHDQIDYIKKAIKLFNKEKVLIVYHLGDFCSPFTLKLFGDLKCSVKAVFGNNDGDIFKLQKYKPDNLEFFDKNYVDEFNGKFIFLTHGESEDAIEEIFHSNKHDLVLRGHNHVAEIKKVARTTLINPGCLINGFNKETKHWTSPSIAVYDLEKDKAKIIKL